MIIMFFMWDFSAGALRAGGIYVAAICLILIGIPQGISNIMTYAMIGDTVDYLEWKTGERGAALRTPAGFRSARPVRRRPGAQRRRTKVLRVFH